jgi:uncharacterized protein
MPHPHHEIARRFISALSAGALPDELLTDDMHAWTLSSGAWVEKQRYQGGVQLLASLFDGPYSYSIDALTAEEDRVVCEARASGTLAGGDAFSNTYVFILRIRDGRIASVSEHFNTIPVREVLGPLIHAKLAKA